MTELQIITIIITITLSFLGASVGSFLNAAALRRADGRGFISGRSHCPTCYQVLKWYDLVPVISWLALLGRCRSCRVRIPPRYPLTELTAAIAFALSFTVYGFAYAALLSLGVAVVLLAVSLIDLSTTEIPNGLVIALVPFAVAAVFVFPEVSVLSRGIGFFTVSLPMLIVAIAISGAFGGGDIKLMAVCGFLLGWQNSLLAFFIAVLIGGGFAVYLLVSGKRGRGEHMVFGPALCTGVFIAQLFGYRIVDWYMGLLVF